jgi:hypothetical protein
MHVLDVDVALLFPLRSRELALDNLLIMFRTFLEVLAVFIGHRQTRMQHTKEKRDEKIMELKKIYGIG